MVPEDSQALIHYLLCWFPVVCSIFKCLEQSANIFQTSHSDRDTLSCKMKAFLSLAYVLLAINPAIAGLAPVPINGVLPGSPPHNPAALRVREDRDYREDRDHRDDREDRDEHTGLNGKSLAQASQRSDNAEYDIYQGCKADNVNQALRHP